MGFFFWAKLTPTARARTHSSLPPASTILPTLTFLCLFSLLLIAPEVRSQTVYVTRTGEKYHNDGCRYLSRSQIETTVAKAKENGYTACSVCKPPVKASSATTATPLKTTPTTPTIKRATSTQCTALTKSKKRCSRMTTNASGRCWQHE